MSAADHPGRYAVVHLSTVHASTDNRIYRKECTALHEAGVSVAFVSRGPGPSGEVPWIELPPQVGRLARMVEGPWHAWRALRRLDPAVLHLHDPELIPLGLLWKRRTAGRVVYDAHEDLPKQVAGKPYLPRWSRRVVAAFARRLEGVAERSFDAVVVATPPIAKNFDRARRVVLVQNFPWLRDFPPPSPIEEGDGRTVCYVGGLSRGRGSAAMVAAVTSSALPLRLRVAGRRDADATADLESLGTRLVDHGQVDAREIPEIVRQSSVGLVLLEPLPNYLESQPTKIFEYMAAGRPFLASDFEYWRRLLADYDCGIFVDVDDADETTRVLDGLVSDPTRVAEMGANGRRALETHFTFESQAADLVRLAQDLLVAAGR